MNQIDSRNLDASNTRRIEMNTSPSHIHAGDCDPGIGFSQPWRSAPKVIDLFSGTCVALGPSRGHLLRICCLTGSFSSFWWSGRCSAAVDEIFFREGGTDTKTEPACKSSLCTCVPEYPDESDLMYLSEADMSYEIQKWAWSV